MNRKNIHWSIVLLLISVFLYSAIAKVLDFNKFSSELAKSPFLSGISGTLAFAVPLVEGGVALMLFMPKARLWGLYAYLYLIASFTFYVYLMMKKAFHVPCACMGLFESILGWKEHFILNIILTVLTLLAIQLESKGQYGNLSGSGNKKAKHKTQRILADQLRPVGKDLKNRDGNNLSLNFKVMLKKFLTMSAVVAAVGGAFVGSSNAKSLLQDERWVIEGQSGLHSTAAALGECPGDLDTCAYAVNANGTPTGEKFGYEEN